MFSKPLTIAVYRHFESLSMRDIHISLPLIGKPRKLSTIKNHIDNFISEDFRQIFLKENQFIKIFLAKSLKYSLQRTESLLNPW